MVNFNTYVRPNVMDFRALMDFLNSFVKVSVFRFERFLFDALMMNYYVRPEVLQFDADKAYFLAQGMVYAIYDDDQEIVPFQIFVSGDIANYSRVLYARKAGQRPFLLCWKGQCPQRAA